MTSKKYPYRKVITGPDGRRYDIKANSELELGRKLAQLEMKLKEGDTRVVSGNMTLTQWAEQCIETYKTNQNDITRQKYWLRIKHCILSEIGSMKLQSIRPINCQQVLNKQCGKSKTQINEVYQAFHFIFKHAKAENLIAVDPTLNLIKPQAAKMVPRRALTPNERRYVIQVGLTDRRYYLFLLMLLCGCRPSEAAEAQGKDIIRDSDGLYLLHIRGTKTRNADRVVPIFEPLLDVIKDTPTLEYIAQTRDGNKLERTARQRVWRSFKRELNLAMGCKTYRNQLVPPYPLAADLVPYCFRHEYCTELARRGVDIREAQLMMGHSDISLTADIYTNLDSKEVAKSVAKTLKSVETDVETVM